MFTRATCAPPRGHDQDPGECTGNAEASQESVYAFCFFLGLVVVDTSASAFFFDFLGPSSLMASGGILRAVQGGPEQ